MSAECRLTSCELLVLTTYVSGRDMLVKAIVQCSSTIDLTVMVADHDSEAIDAFISTLIKKHLSPYAGMMDDEEPNRRRLGFIILVVQCTLGATIVFSF